MRVRSSAQGGAPPDGGGAGGKGPAREDDGPPRGRRQDPVPLGDRGAVYGYSNGWRYELEQADIFHVVATTRHGTVVTRQALDHPLHELVAGLPRQKWKRRSCGEGAHGPRIYDWARVEVRPWHRPDRKHWVLARRSIAEPTKVAHYIAYAPAGATLNELIAVAGACWAIKECFRTAKGQCGLDDYQVRHCPGWHRHGKPAL